MANELSELDAALAGGLESAGAEPAPTLDFSSLYGDADYEGREDRTPAQPDPEPKATPAADEELRALRARVDGHDQLVAQARFEAEQRQQQQWQRSQEEAGYNAAMQEAQRLATVPDVNPDEILGDPAKFRAHNQGLVNQAIRATIKALEPARQEIGQLRSASQQNLRQAQVAALNVATQMLADPTMNLAHEFTAEEQAAVVQRLRSMRDGELMLADPQQVVNAYVLSRVERGLGVQPRKQPKAPTNVPTNGTRRANTGRVPFNRLPPAAQTMMSRLRVPTGDLTPDELEQLRAAGI